MLKLSCVIIIILLIVEACGHFGKGIPREVGNWYVEVGPPGNEFYEPPPFENDPPSERVSSLILWSSAA